MKGLRASGRKSGQDKQGERSIVRRVICQGMMRMIYFYLYIDGKNSGQYNSPSFAGGIAQLGERLHGMQEVSGSIPLTSTSLWQYHKLTANGF